MHILEIKKRVEEIKEVKHDPEVAHALEDQLFYNFVNAIKDNDFDDLEDVVYAAEEVMKVREIEFGRWHA